MTDASTPSAPSAPTTDISNPVTTPVSSAKPYDDEVFNSYTDSPEGEEAPKTAESTDEDSTEESPVPESPKTEEINKGTKNDKIDDGFEDVPIKKLINGKEVQFKVKDAIQAYIQQEEFNRNADRRMSEIDSRKKAWDRDQQAFKGNLMKLIQVAQKGDFITAAKGLAKIATHGTDLDPTDFERQYFDQLDKVGEVYTKLTPEQREAYFTKRALAEAKQRAEQLEGEKNSVIGRTQLEQSVKALQQQYGVSHDEFWDNYKVLAENLVERGIIQSPDELQAEHVVGYSLEVRRQATVFEAAEKAGLNDDAKVAYLSSLTKSDPSLTVEDIVDIIKNSQLVEVAPADAVENLNRKVGNRYSQLSSDKASSTKKDERLNGYDKEDIEFLYRKTRR